MPIGDPSEILTTAHSGGYAIGAFNVTSLMEIGFIIEAPRIWHLRWSGDVLR